MELGEMTELKESLLRDIREMEKKMKSTQHEKDTLLANLQQSDRAKRQVCFVHYFLYDDDINITLFGCSRRQTDFSNQMTLF